LGTSFDGHRLSLEENRREGTTFDERAEGHAQGDRKPSINLRRCVRKQGVPETAVPVFLTKAAGYDLSVIAEKASCFRDVFDLLRIQSS